MDGPAGMQVITSHWASNCQWNVTEPSFGPFLAVPQVMTIPAKGHTLPLRPTSSMLAHTMDGVYSRVITAMIANGAPK